jgi:phosphopantothenoylcysteine decarboxylase/phosphopantothenate--cysteine ligase
LNIKFIRNPDIAAYYGKQKNQQIMVGFAAETNNVFEYASEKLKKKNLDFIVANDVTEVGAGFKSDTNIVAIIDKNGNVEKHPIMSKKEVAKVILDKVSLLMNKDA